ncbi:hypothetical protein DF156_23010 [Burkholderia ubonensis]|uniref:Uncharacterized protein n=1 Tax=Burkholderia ubonensis TaxID=101571 RepID=A0AB74D412_9BURK|nr:hypothetical protein CJO71_20190 [Burkholderia ubonensis]PAJ95183.1 hypothetical protein CJO69_08090 [Burkholderia ubonensis]PAK06349.1 hypothetical protein CJO67_19500 [Burkholderia ubonensis]PAK11419.1 hypothetical protein CJO66_28935 [Burkholderia ubonensis]RQP33541.1 hypothetical protein DF154_25575 [Burkholderia ubonensis]
MRGGSKPAVTRDSRSAFGERDWRGACGDCDRCDKRNECDECDECRDTRPHAPAARHRLSYGSPARRAAGP